MIRATLVVFLHALTAVSLGWLYFRRYAVQRPPIGVINLGDVAFILAAIVLVPYLYLALPVWLLAGLLGLGALSILYLTFEPLSPVRWPIWLVAIALLTLDAGALLRFGPTRPEFLAVNNLLQILAVIGVANLWAQSGMKARDAVLLGAGLVVYDMVFTSVLPLMGDLFEQLDGLAFAPLVAWPVGGEGQTLAVGLGDLLLATVFPLVVRKAYSRRAGLVALIVACAALGAVLASPALGLLQGIFPVMALLGPLMLVQYLYWRHRLGDERATWQYLQAEPQADLSPLHPSGLR